MLNSYFRKPFYTNIPKTAEERKQEQEQKIQEAKLRAEQQNTQFLERYQDFVDTFNCLYPDIKHKYIIEKVMAGYGLYPFIYINLKNLTNKKETKFHLNHETNQWHITRNNCLWDDSKYEILEPLTTKDQMDTILKELNKEVINQL